MKLIKTLLSAGVVTAVAAGTFAGVSAVNAHGDGTNKDELIDRIAADAGVDRTTIEASFEAHREEMKAERETARAERLDGLVADGTLTQEQRDALEAKFSEMQDAKEALRDQDLTREEMHQQMEQTRDEFEAWAEEQGIDLDAIKPEGGRGHGRRGFGHQHQQEESTDDSSEES